MIEGIASGVRAAFQIVPMSVLFVRKQFWREADGFIVEAGLQNHTDFEGERLTYYMLAYRYTVDGVQYFGVDSIPLEGDYLENQDRVIELNVAFSLGQRIQIYVSPNDPSPSSARRGVVGLGKAILLVTAGVFLAIVFYYYALAANGLL